MALDREHRTAGSPSAKVPLPARAALPQPPGRWAPAPLLRSFPEASADSLTRHATPAASSSHYASDLCCRHCGLPLCPHTRPAYDAPLGLCPSRLPALHHASRFTRQAAAKAPGRGAAASANGSANSKRSTPPAACSLFLCASDGQRTQPSGLSGMGLINREKRQHAWPARTMAPPTFACAGVRAPRCSLVRCPSHQRPQTSGHPGALAHTCFPKVAALGPEASDSAPPRPERALARLLGPVNGVGGLTAVRPLRTSLALYAPTLPTVPRRPPCAL